MKMKQISGLKKTYSKSEIIDMLNKMPDKPIYVCVNHTKLDNDGGFKGTLLPIDLCMYDEWEKYIAIDVNFSEPKALDENIDVEKFRKELMEYFGFADGVGTHIWEQTGDYTNTKNPPIKKIKKSFVNEIITVLDSCRKGL